ncbi:RNA-binding cell elongation regulator Jag/EloR [uncultured Mitsuokella sp.]|uniref:RNA-binding cell elongation regulator Jag/EloR n=1 Tax=uncultured Mitsuokella sp. TaxID=453120 RepID=UPI00266F3FE8|nr:RNA-binding cell elongation regulator Jag/EloR [uncultured Mitsuokella sp.]
MAETMEWTGKTVEAALSAAAAELGCAADSLEYTVIEQPSRGFLGLIGRKPARIRVRQEEDAAAAAPLAEDPSADMIELETHLAEEAEETGTESGADEDKPAVSEEKQAVSFEEQEVRAKKFLEEIFAAMHIPVSLQRSENEDGVLFQLEGEDLGILIGKHGQTLDALQYLTNLAANRGVSGNRLHVLLDVEGYRARREETLSRLAGHLAEKACRIGQEIHLEPMNRHERKIIHMALQDSRRVTTYSAGEEPRRCVVIVPRRRRRAEGRRNRDHEEE